MIGIVGGVGLYAGVDLLKKIYDNTIAKTDQDYLDTLLLSLSSKILDRTEYLLNKNLENPGYAIATVITNLYLAGATVVGIPCNTAHSKEIFGVVKSELKSKKQSIKLLSMIEETTTFISKNYPIITKVGILSTTGTFKSKIYNSSLEVNNYEVVLPPLNMQENIIHPAIYDPIYGIKSTSNSIHPQARENLLKGISSLKEQGAEIVILACTEIPLAITEKEINGLIIIDPTNILARAMLREYYPEKLKPL
ncbi:MAG: amino acid racemase [Flavobacteriaceae bacterium]|nr:amino acid racemase [Flavobacteriaceae bacterium]